MISPTRALRSGLFLLLGLPLPALYRFCFRRDTGRNEEVRVGECVFWGPSVFTATCQRAAEELRRLDRPMFDSLTRGGRITFWLHPNPRWPPIHHYGARLYGVPSAYMPWAERGVVAFMVHVYFLESYAWRVFGVSIGIERRGRCSRQSTADWLRERGFPTGLAEAFDPGDKV